MKKGRKAVKVMVTLFHLRHGPTNSLAILYSQALRALCVCMSSKAAVLTPPVRLVYKQTHTNTEIIVNRRVEKHPLGYIESRGRERDEPSLRMVLCCLVEIFLFCFRSFSSSLIRVATGTAPGLVATPLASRSRRVPLSHYAEQCKKGERRATGTIVCISNDD